MAGLGEMMLPFSCTRAASISTSFKRRPKDACHAEWTCISICCTKLKMAREGTGVPPRFVPSVKSGEEGTTPKPEMIFLPSSWSCWKRPEVEQTESPG